jgi:ankyrin repeat protein
MPSTPHSDAKRTPEDLGRELIAETRAEGRTAQALALIKAGAALDVQDDAGGTPLLWATTLGRTQIALALIKAGAPLEQKAGNGDTAFLAAIIYNRGQIADALVEAGARLDQKDIAGLSGTDWARVKEATAVPPDRSYVSLIETAREQRITDAVVLRKDMPVGRRLRLKKPRQGAP